MLLSLGMTLVIATGGVDLSVGAVMAISGAVAATIVNQPDGNFAVAVVAAIGHRFWPGHGTVCWWACFEFSQSWPR